MGEISSYGPVGLGKPPFFKGLHPLPDNIGGFYDRALSIEGNVFEACTTCGHRSKRLYYAFLKHSFYTQGTGCLANFKRNNHQGDRGCGNRGGCGGPGRLDRPEDQKDPQGSVSSSALSECQSNKRAPGEQAEEARRAGGKLRQFEEEISGQGMDPTS